MTSWRKFSRIRGGLVIGVNDEEVVRIDLQHTPKSDVEQSRIERERDLVNLERERDGFPW